jgi:hypothetical protein
MRRILVLAFFILFPCLISSQETGTLNATKVVAFCGGYIDLPYSYCVDDQKMGPDFAVNRIIPCKQSQECASLSVYGGNYPLFEPPPNALLIYGSFQGNSIVWYEWQEESATASVYNIVACQCSGYGDCLEANKLMTVLQKELFKSNQKRSKNNDMQKQRLRKKGLVEPTEVEIDAQLPEWLSSGECMAMLVSIRGIDKVMIEELRGAFQTYRAKTA